MLADRTARKWRLFTAKQIKRRAMPHKPPSYKSEKFSESIEDMSAYSLEDDSHHQSKSVIDENRGSQSLSESVLNKFFKKKISSHMEQLNELKKKGI